ncbi:hypothetical protein [Candidatus Magnetomonas plexicatena]|uniref:hypothetical protein n=1 Tax=Candidatus Magnetomonas plexicatena TaxID=2552947 RepID=UPI001C7692AD|nr:hypothetical protein E2O03_006060 [Nitrospirales bacterium LBB_01]
MYFNREYLKLQALSERVHDLNIDVILPLTANDNPPIPAISEAASHIISTKERGAAVILMMGGHVIRSGVQRFIIDLMERGYITCIAGNGSCVIHDYEFALIGATTESVAKYIKCGEFGLWKETGYINDIINAAYRDNNSSGYGGAIGKAIYEGDFPHKDISLYAAAYRLNIPATVHVGIGYDIINEFPNYDGAAAGALSYMDFLRFTQVVSALEGGVVMNFGSAVMAPEVFLKALSMVRNRAHQSGERINDFTTLVCDLHQLPADFTKEAPKDSPPYYFRPWKTMLVRTVADGGRAFYVCGKHADTVSALWSTVKRLSEL